jgi:hypothetical protein
MINYLTNFNTDGASFPNTAGVNVSAPSAGDGTEFKALLINDHWGARQALMDYAGLSPNGSSESATNSQFLTALKNALSPVGMVIMSHAKNDPATLGQRLLELNGQGILRANYTELDSVCYVGDGRNSSAEYYYRATDSGGSSRSTTGAYLILPDMRGIFARGYDPTGVQDPGGTTRGFPDFQYFALQDHHHEVTCEILAIKTFSKLDKIGTTGTDFSTFGSDTASASDVLEAKLIIPPNGTAVKVSPSETRVSNVQVKYWLRY